MVQYAPLKNFYIVVHMDSEKFQIFRLQFHTVQTMWVFLLVPKGEHVKPSKSLPTFRLYVSSIWTTDLGLHGSDSEPWWAVGTTNRCLRPSLRCAIWLAVNKRGTFLKVTSSCFFDQLKLLKLSFCSFVFWCVCVFFFWGDHDLKVDFDGTEGIYIYIYTDRFWAVGLSKWYWLWFLLIYVHIYVAKFIIHCHMILLPAPSCAIFHVLGLPPVAPKRIVTGALWFWGFWKSFNVARPRGNATSWCPSATSLSWPRQTCQSGLAIQLERNLLLLFQLLLEHRHLTTRNFHISFTFIYHLTIIPAEKSSISNAFFLLW